MNWTVHGHKCLSFFLFFRFFKLRERERVVYKILGIKEKWPQSYLSYFSTGFHWRIFLLSRANRLYAIFNTGLENLGPSCPQIFFFCLLHPEYLAMGLSVALYGFPAKAGDSFVCFGAKPDKGFLDLKSRRTRKWYRDANESWRRDPAEGSWRLDSREASSRGLAWKNGQGQSTPDTGAERRGSMG